MKKTVLITSGIIVLLAVFTGAAFLVGRLLRSGSTQEQSISGQPQLLEAGDQSGPQMVSVQLKKSKELPDREPDVMGFYSRREDNSIFVNVTEGGVIIQIGEDGEMSTNTGDKETEIVTTNETTVYRDATVDSIDTSSGGGEYEQILKPGSLDEIGEMSSVLAWGEMRGDRLIAEILVYNRPPVISR